MKANRKLISVCSEKKVKDYYFCKSLANFFDDSLILNINEGAFQLCEKLVPNFTRRDYFLNNKFCQDSFDKVLNFYRRTNKYFWSPHLEVMLTINPKEEYVFVYGVKDRYDMSLLKTMGAINIFYGNDHEDLDLFDVIHQEDGNLSKVILETVCMIENKWSQHDQLQKV